MLSDPQYAEVEDFASKLEMFKRENSIKSNRITLFVHSCVFCNEITFGFIADKYMEFDLNDQGEIGETVS